MSKSRRVRHCINFLGACHFALCYMPLVVNLGGIGFDANTSQDKLKSYWNGLQLDPIRICIVEPKLYVMITITLCLYRDANE